MNDRRSSGWSASRGRYAPPAFRMASTVTTASGERFEAHRDRLVGSHTHGHQTLAQRVGLPIQVAVTEAATVPQQRDRVRCVGRLLAKQRVQGGAGPVSPLGAIPVDEYTLALSGGERVHGAKQGISHDRPGYHEQEFAESRDTCGLDERTGGADQSTRTTSPDQRQTVRVGTHVSAALCRPGALD